MEEGKAVTDIKIITPRLILRQWKTSDHEPYIAMNMDSDVMKYFLAIQTREDSLAQIKRITSNIYEKGFGLFAVERKDNQQFIGFIGLAEPRFESYFTPCIEIGWRLSKENWGQGFAQEGAKACLQFGFERLGLNEILSWTSIHNLPSINVMQKIRMKETGFFDHPNVPEGNWLRRHVFYKTERP